MRTGRTLLDRQLLRRFARDHSQGMFLSLLALFFLLSRAEISYYLFLYAAGFLYAHLFYQEKWSWLRKLLLAPLFSAAALVLTGSLFDLAGISFGVSCIYLVWFGSVLIGALTPLNISVSDVRDYRGYLFEIGIAAIFAIGLAARVIPVWSEPAPILHDPVAHAAYAKGIIQTGEMQRFYSPGLHFNIALSALTTQADLARSTLMLTQFFSALVSVAASIFVVESSNRRSWGFLAAALFAVGSYPASFYTAAGKNSLIFATGLLFLTWGVFWADIGWLRKILLCNAMLLATILSHYPAAFICCLGLGGVFFLAQNKWRFAYSVIFALMVGLLWGAVKLPYQVEHARTRQFNAAAPRESLRDILTWNRFETEAVKYVKSLVSRLLIGNRDYEKSLGMVGFLLLVYLGVTERRLLFLPLTFLANDLLVAIGQVFQFARSFSQLRIITSTQLISADLFSYLLVSLALSILLFEIWKGSGVKNRRVSALLVMAVVVMGAIGLGQAYDQYQTNYGVVHQSDLAAFKWMNENLNPSDKILVDAYVYQSRQKIVVFATDSGVWIPVYTNLRISSDFVEFSDSDVYKATKLYLRFSQNPASCTLKEKILGNGFDYYFRGSNPAHGRAQLDPAELSSSTFRLVYENGPVGIYRIVPCGG